MPELGFIPRSMVTEYKLLECIVAFHQRELDSPQEHLGSIMPQQKSFPLTLFYYLISNSPYRLPFNYYVSLEDLVLDQPIIP